MTTLEYQERAQYCRAMARAATTDGVRADWLKVAEMWLQMASDNERRSPEGAFQVETDAKMTGQKDSDASH